MFALSKYLLVNNSYFYDLLCADLFAEETLFFLNLANPGFVIFFVLYKTDIDYCLVNILVPVIPLLSFIPFIYICISYIGYTLFNFA